MHLCRGNFQSTFVASGGYEPVAEILFNEIKIDAYFMEYDSERAGGFEPLRFVPKGKMVVLGLVTSKSGTLETKDELKRRIDEAAKFVPLDQLCLSPQCGFASTEEGNILTEDEQWAKLAHVSRWRRRCGDNRRSCEPYPPPRKRACRVACDGIATEAPTPTPPHHFVLRGEGMRRRWQARNEHATHQAAISRRPRRQPAAPGRAEGRRARSAPRARSRAAELKAVEDREIERVIKKQEEVGLQGITDGEFRRSWWHLDFLWGLDGFERYAMAQGVVVCRACRPAPRAPASSARSASPTIR